MTDTFEHYQLLKNEDGSFVELGHGSMGVTYKAFDTSLRCHVALKVIAASLLNDATVAERFLREARGAAQLRHRNVATVFHLGKREDTYFYAMEFIDGETVDELVKRDGPLDCLSALDIAQQVACALIAAEKQHLVHRDIKPSNLMLVRESDGEVLVKVIDFGLVKSALMQSTSGALTSGGFVGTPYFASPEQLDQHAEDIRSDIYSLGVTLWYMLTGKPTFIGSVASVIAQHLDRAPSFESLAILPAQVVAVLKRMLEKDPDQRIQTPAELRAELKSAIESLRAAQPLATPHREFGENFETIALSSHGSKPRIGALLNERYRLIEDINPANPGRVFHGEDTVAKRRVLVRILRIDKAASDQITEEADRVKCVSHPGFVEVLAVERARNFTFAVFEWLEGFSLVDLLRARHELTLRETLLLLKQIAPAVDEARDTNLKLEMNLRDILVHFSEGLAETVATDLLRCPLDEWPTFSVKLNPLGNAKELESSDTWAGARTIVASDRSKKQPDVVQLGILTYELLGGKSGSFAPLANVPEAGNEILRRCLTPDRTFPTAREFYNALSGSATTETSPAAPLRKKIAEPPTEPPPEQAPQFPAAAPASVATPKPVPVETKSKETRVVFIAAAVILVLLAGGAILFFQSGPERPPVSSTTASAPTAPKLAPAAVALAPLQAGQPWTNSLAMQFVPLGNVHVSVAQTRVADFSAFVEATGYDAVGGMSSVVIQDGFKQNAMSWKAPGFPQTPEHPVVGVCWEDANQFCAWLTKKERSVGALKSYQSYRLPTDREWSEAVGLGYEPGANPEERSGKMKGLYPWGRTFPPPADSANYAGSESRAGAPENWAGIAGFHDSFARTAPASAFPPNAHGLRNLGGNVWEWCVDKFDGKTNWRTLRGGSWATSRAGEMLSSFRRGYDPLFRNDDVGFRCVIATDGGQ